MQPKGYKGNISQQQLDDIVKNAGNAPTEKEEYDRILLERIKTLRVDVNEDMAPDDYTFNIGGVETFACEGIHCIKAKAKMGKTTTLSILMSIAIGKVGEWGSVKRNRVKPYKVLFIDTEQKAYDSQRFKKNVLRMGGTTQEEAGDNLEVYNFRSVMDDGDKREIILRIIQMYEPDILVIDGVVDLCTNFNDVDDSKQLMAWLMKIADEFHLALFCVLHTNKNQQDYNMRGHLGTMLDQKCDTTTECSKDAGTGIVTVKCVSSRHRPYPDFFFTWDDQGNVISADQRQAEIALQRAENAKAEKAKKSAALKETRKNDMLEILKSHQGAMKRSDLNNLLEAKWKMSRQTVYNHLTEWLNEGIIYENPDHVILTTSSDTLF